jgi:hypothetical protein
MPFVSQEDWDRLLSDNMRLSGELNFYRSLGGVIGLARLLQSEISERLENEPGMTTSEIGDAAYTAVYAAGVNAVRQQQVTEFQERYRANLCALVVEQGERLFEIAKLQIESDPDLMLKLRESARKEISQRAHSTVTATITAEQQEIINEEADRQITLDRFDTEFAVDGELDLHRDDITEAIKPGDTLILTYITAHGSSFEQRLTLRWTADAKCREGWVIEQYGQVRMKHPDGYFREPNDLDKFLFIGSIQKDMVEGITVDIPNVLKQGSPILFAHEVTKGKREGELKKLDIGVPASSNYSYSQTIYPLLLKSIDFRTRSLYFNGQ